MQRMTFVAILLSMLLTACGSKDSPAKAAREWTEAVLQLDGLKLQELTCASQQGTVENSTVFASAFSTLSPQLTSEQVNSDISALRFDALNHSDNGAEVQVYGEMRIAVLTSAQAHKISTTYSMIQEDGTWKWCGEVSDPIATVRRLIQLVEDDEFEVMDQLVCSSGGTATSANFSIYQYHIGPSMRSFPAYIQAFSDALSYEFDLEYTNVQRENENATLHVKGTVSRKFKPNENLSDALRGHLSFWYTGQELEDEVKEEMDRLVTDLNGTRTIDGDVLLVKEGDEWKLCSTDALKPIVEWYR